MYCLHAMWRNSYCNISYTVLLQKPANTNASLKTYSVKMHPKFFCTKTAVRIEMSLRIRQGHFKVIYYATVSHLSSW